MKPGLKVRTLQQIAALLIRRSQVMPNGCREWLGSTNAQGYGTINWGGKIHKAHRISFRIHKGKDAGRRDVCHSCDNPRCIEPSHLFAGTRLQNMRDAVAKGRMRHGSSHYQSKLTEEIVREIRQRFADGAITMLALATELGCSNSVISEAISRKTWRHVT